MTTITGAIGLLHYGQWIGNDALFPYKPIAKGVHRDQIFVARGCGHVFVFGFAQPTVHRIAGDVGKLLDLQILNQNIQSTPDILAVVLRDFAPTHTIDLQMLEILFDVIGDGCLAVFGDFDFLRCDEAGTYLFLFGKDIREDALGSLLIAAAGGDAFVVAGMIGVSGIRVIDSQGLQQPSPPDAWQATPTGAVHRGHARFARGAGTHDSQGGDLDEHG